MTVAPAPLVRLARLFGIAPSYRTNSGQSRAIAPETLQALLAVLGLAVNSSAAAAQAAAEEKRRRRALAIAAAQVHRGRERPEVEFASRRALGASSAELVLELEDGTTEHLRLGSLEPLASARGRRRVRLPAPLPFGVHTVHLVGNHFSASGHLLVAPETLPGTARGWGAFLPAYAARGAQDLGIGTYGDLRDLADYLGAKGAAFLATLPLYAPYEGPAVEPSPYLPASRLAWNPLLLDLEALVRQRGDDEARAAYRELAATTAGSASHEVDYEAVLRSRETLWSRLAFLATSDRASTAAMARFFAQHPELEAYCAFRAEHDDSRCVPRGVSTFARLAVHRYLQFAAHGQLAALASASPGLMLDLPIGVHPLGFDTAHFAPSFAFGATVGAPPDPFQRDGQDWSFPPPHPNRQRADGYHYFRTCLAAAFSYASVLRIDHVMALERLWWIPQGAAATDGAYVASPSAELHAVLAIEAHRAGVTIVGEDLGTVPEATVRAMDEQEMLHCAVLQFRLGAEGPLPKLPARSVASIGTHDLPKFAAFFSGSDLLGASAGENATRAALRTHLLTELGLLAHDDEEQEADDQPILHSALLAIFEYLAKSDADLVLVDLEDCWLEREPINRPGTPASANWRRRSRYRLDELVRDPVVAQLLGAVQLGRGRL